MPLGGDAIEEVVAALGRARLFLRRRLAPTLHLKYVPDLAFRSDESFDESARVASLLRKPSVARDLVVPDRDDDDGA
jgi:ribosome-binding factor A